MNPAESLMLSSSFLQLLAQTELIPPQQQGILDFVRGSGFVVQGVLYLLVLFSVVSWGIIFYKYREVRAAKNQSDKFIETFWESRNLSAIMIPAGSSNRV